MAHRTLETDGCGGVTLHVPRGGDLTFTAEWWDTDSDKVEVASARGSIISTSDGTVVLDLADYISVVDGSVTVNVPGSVTEALVDWGDGIWSLVATAVDGRQKVLIEGLASYGSVL